MFIKKIVLILLCFSFVLTQEPCIGTCYTEEEEQNIELHISTLEQSDSLNFIEIKELKSVIKLYETKSKNDSLWLDLQIQKNNLLDNRIKLYDDLVKEVKPKWYENKWLWFGLGVVFTATSVKLAGEIVD
tara:strand:- start:128 stop:517 length:390 start_codon:yes stop_codon:yes gene_type:complete